MVKIQVNHPIVPITEPIRSAVSWYNPNNDQWNLQIYHGSEKYNVLIPLFGSIEIFD